METIKFTSEDVENMVNNIDYLTEECFDIYPNDDMIITINNGYRNAIMDIIVHKWDDTSMKWISGARTRVAKQGNLFDDICFGIERVLEKYDMLE